VSDQLTECLEEKLIQPLLLREDPILVVARQQRASVQFHGLAERPEPLDVTSGRRGVLKRPLKLPDIRGDRRGIHSH
jgi:hypothetical protein